MGLVARIRTHPGDILGQEFLAPLGLSASRLAGEIGLPASAVLAIVRGRRNVSADVALRLSRRFGTSPQFWLNLQNAFDLSTAQATHDYSAILPPRAVA